ncbi:ROK family protein [Levilactobacillus brevis]|uniref:ROK family protein n=1 Tax=Levilactobacillus brevis TaxID=1580 RepID=UPI00063AF2F5|nr:ROK family protein [Levilactobacillus brevis]KLE30057.1 ROK family transcriptional regulator [Levilactobacillus brevis]MBX6948315.1 ROK family protein [Levilactobacillus brevis]MCT3570180.1 ROK family protein [Levilactobacillus brevis]MCT3578154.1 ROK family protein [Levilactobacillus brevis]MCZ2125474.1 ROK family protein [Levilactobacillus brevis]
MIINKHIMRTTNEKQVLQQIVNAGPISRSQISRNLCLNKVTVSDIYSQLLHEGLIREVGHGVSTRNGGRKPVMALLNVGYGYVISINILRSRFSMITCRLDGRSDNYESVSTRDVDLTTVLDMIDERIANTIAASDSRLLGIAFGLDGVIYENQILSAALKGFKSFDLAKYFSDKFQVPVVLENLANESAIYERDFAGEGVYQDLISVTIRDQVAAGIVADGHLYRGHNGEAGNIGTCPLADRYHEGSSSTVNHLVAEGPVLQRIMAYQHIDRVDVNRIRRDYLGHRPELIAILDEFAYYLGKVLGDLSNTFAPDAIVVNAPILELLPEIMDQVRGHVDRLSIRRKAPLLLSKNAKEASLTGGASAIIHKALGLDDLQLTFKNERSAVLEEVES